MPSKLLRDIHCQVPLNSANKQMHLPYISRFRSPLRFFLTILPSLFLFPSMCPVIILRRLSCFASAAPRPYSAPDGETPQGAELSLLTCPSRQRNSPKYRRQVPADFCVVPWLTVVGLCLCLCLDDAVTVHRTSCWHT